MIRRLLFTAWTLLSCTGLACAQADPHCAVRPTSLAAMRNCYRPLLVFSPKAEDARLQQQGSILDADADDMMDRFVILTPVLADRKDYRTPLDAPYVVLSAKEMLAIRERFHVSANRFVVLLLGEDGSVKLHSEQPVDAARLNELIDAMPTRKVEQERPHAN